MGKGVLITIVVVAVVIIAAGVWLGLGYAIGGASGPVVNEDRRVSEFDKVRVSGGGTLIITSGEQPGLRIEGRRDALDRIRVEVEGDTLSIGERWDWLRFGPFWDMGEITYYLSAPTLVSVELSGAVGVRNEAWLKGDVLDLDCSGSSVVDLDVELQTLNIRASGSSDITLRGSTAELSLHASGSTRVGARDLVAGTVTVDCSGSSDIVVNATERLSIDASGSSDISYLGDPAVESDISGSGGLERLSE